MSVPTHLLVKVIAILLALNSHLTDRQISDVPFFFFSFSLFLETPAVALDHHHHKVTNHRPVDRLPYIIPVWALTGRSPDPTSLPNSPTST